jgi:centromeric protein E
VAHLSLVDLAGSERASQTGTSGKRFNEGTNINKSLMQLGVIIAKLSEGRKEHMSFRSSKLTRILKNSLGGNTRFEKYFKDVLLVMTVFNIRYYFLIIFV